MKRHLAGGLLLLALAALGCGGSSANAHSKDVGASCTSDRDCTNRCTFNDTFGSSAAGMCTRSCTSDKDCPSGAACTNRDNGICAVTCAQNSDCSDFGRGFQCSSVGRFGGGSINVCRLP